MTPVVQTAIPTKANLRGNCYAACIASVMECRLEDVPQWTDGVYSAADGAAWFCYEYDLRVWLAKRGWEMRSFRARGLCAPKGYAIAGYRMPSGRLHAVVCLDGQVVHDPMGATEEYGAREWWTVLTKVAA